MISNIYLRPIPEADWLFCIRDAIQDNGWSYIREITEYQWGERERIKSNTPRYIDGMCMGRLICLMSRYLKTFLLANDTAHTHTSQLKVGTIDCNFCSRVTSLNGVYLQNHTYVFWNWWGEHQIIRSITFNSLLGVTCYLGCRLVDWFWTCIFAWKMCFNGLFATIL